MIFANSSLASPLSAYSQSADSDSSSESSSRQSSPLSSPPPSPLKASDDNILQWPPSLDPTNRQSPRLPDVFPQLPAFVTPEIVAGADTQTPDNWVKRNPELIRLTGRHPFNCEAPLPQLMSSGFFTPTHLHFVRNHGAVPRVDRDAFRAWSIRIHGLVSREVTFTLQELRTRFRTVTLPITLVCAGNRRKEQNIVRKSLGFDWGSAGLSTALWTGVFLADVLDYIRPLSGKAKYVIFEGADNLPNGPYGTSQRLSWARNKDKGMLIAWAMNGLPLEPDHGFPVRVIIPGQIGGRSVKWLRSIEVSALESKHYLHYWDNKVLPRGLSPDYARVNSDWWYDPAYLITELNVNSAITSPGHNETLDIVTADCDKKTYTLRGYAYSGGGRRVNRCEVSLDEGRTWSLCRMEYPEDRFRNLEYRDDVYGSLDLTESDSSFCWCFWSIEIPLTSLSQAHVIELCAMDESMNMQPRDIYLNATSMLNNWLFRVAILKAETKDGLQLRFEHPAPVGTADPGWMKRLKSKGQAIAPPNFSSHNSTHSAFEDNASVSDVSMIKPSVARTITPEELASREKEHPWFVVRGEVYDGTPFLTAHPGGPDSILVAAGEDATEDFLAIHSAEGRSKLAEYHIGTLISSPTAEREIKEKQITESSSASFLQPKIWKRLKLSKLSPVNHDSCIFRFALGNGTQPFGLPCGHHIFLRLRRVDTGEVVQRAYTPISPVDSTGCIDVLIKLYLPTEKFPSGGKMSAALERLSVGDEVEIKGPVGTFEWTGLGSYRWRSAPRRVSQVGMICAGSGITPIFQVLRSITDDAQDTETQVWVVYANRTEEDILLRAELADMATRTGPQRLRIHHTLTRPPKDWRGGYGRFNEATFRDHLPPPSDSGIILTCGPSGMVEETVKPALRRLGWDIRNSLVIF